MLTQKLSLTATGFRCPLRTFYNPRLCGIQNLSFITFKVTPPLVKTFSAASQALDLKDPSGTDWVSLEVELPRWFRDALWIKRQCCSREPSNAVRESNRCIVSEGAHKQHNRRLKTKKSSVQGNWEGWDVVQIRSNSSDLSLPTEALCKMSLLHSYM